MTTAAAAAAPGLATSRANNLPWLLTFQSFQGLAAATLTVAAGTSTALATVSVPTALVAAAAGEAAAGKASDVTIPRNQSILTTAAAVSVSTALADDGESLGSDFDLPDDISFSGGGNMGGDENESQGVEEDARVEGAEPAALTSVFDCDHIKQKKMNDKDGWECGWCGKFFTPLHATRALKHVLKIKKGGIIACKALIPPRYLARYTALSGYHSDRIESGKQTIHQIDLSVESTQQSAASSLLRKRGHDGGSSISSAAASTLTGVPSVTRVRGSNIPLERSHMFIPQAVNAPCHP